MRQKLRITNYTFHITIGLVFVFAVIVSIALLEQNAILGFTAALVGGIVLGTLSVIPRETKP